MSCARISKRLIDSIQRTDREVIIWDTDLSGFGVRVRPSGAKSYILLYRAGRGRAAPQRKVTLGPVGKLTPDRARELAKKLLGSVAHGEDPAAERVAETRAITIRELSEVFLSQHVRGKRKLGTVKKYEHVLTKHILPHIGGTRVASLTEAQVSQLHLKLKNLPATANYAVQRRSKRAVPHPPSHYQADGRAD